MPRRVLLFHKPKGVIVTTSDERRRKTIYDLLPEWVRSEGWLPVGRLDQDSRGLLLLVNDSSLIETLTQPGRLAKIYDIWVRGHVSDQHIQALKNGVDTSIGNLRCDDIEILGMVAHKTHLKVILLEGKNRHIRRMFGALRDPEQNTPLKVLELKRIQIGSLLLDVPSGEWRFLNDGEISNILSDSAVKMIHPRRKE